MGFCQKNIFILLGAILCRLLSAAHYDCIMIGSGPCSLLEAISQAAAGARVAVLESSDRMGGAWGTLDVCGVLNVDIGCHQIGSDPRLKSFFETYIGCKMVPLDFAISPTEKAKTSNGFYFSGGCRELIERLSYLLKLYQVDVRFNEKALSATVGDLVLIQTSKESHTCEKLFVTPMSSLSWPQLPHLKTPAKPHPHHHLYLLIQDSTPCRFTYRNANLPSASRIMDLTPFTSLYATGRKLIIIQTHSKALEPQDYLDQMKARDLIDKAAYLLQWEQHTYHASNFNKNAISELKCEAQVELLHTSSFAGMHRYLARWQKNLSPVSP